MKKYIVILLLCCSCSTYKVTVNGIPIESRTFKAPPDTEILIGCAVASYCITRYSMNR